MAKDDEQGKTPTIAEIIQVLDRLAAERKADNAEHKAERKADNEAARERQEAADKRQEAADRRQEAADRRQVAADKRQEAADKRQEAIDRRQEAADKRADKRQEAIDKRQEAADKRADKRQEAIDRQLEAVSKKLREVGRQVGDVGNQWGKIAEYLVAGDLGRILKQRFGITIDHSAECLSGSYQGKDWEVDVFAANGEIALVGEVKLTLTVDAVDKFVQGNLRNFHLYMPVYSDKKIYGMLAFVKMSRGEEKQIASYVHSLGLLLVRVIDNTFHLLTPSDHQLKNYNTAKP